MINFCIALFFMMVFDVILFSVYQEKTRAINRAKNNCTVLTTAVVSDEIIVKERVGKVYSKHSYPVFKFNCGGQEMETKYEYFSIVNGKLKPQYSIGMSVDIKYDPKNPKKIYIPSNKVPFQEGQAILGFMAIISAASFMVGLVCLVADLLF